jgi:hypothetical protein
MDHGEAEVTAGRCLCGDVRFEYCGAPLETGAIVTARAAGDTPPRRSWRSSLLTRAPFGTRKALQSLTCPHRASNARIVGVAARQSHTRTPESSHSGLAPSTTLRR